MPFGEWLAEGPLNDLTLPSRCQIRRSRILGVVGQRLLIVVLHQLKISRERHITAE
jgi:hypothetical protein